MKLTFKKYRAALVASVVAVALAACADRAEEPGTNEAPDARSAEWDVLAEELPAALLSVAGRASNDVWAVGAQVGDRPIAIHYDGESWVQHDVPFNVDLWWVHITPSGRPYFGGSDGAILTLEGERFRRIDELSLARHTVFGIAGEEDDLYAVGSIGARSGFVWHFNGERWQDLPLPKEMPRLEDGTLPGLFKAHVDEAGTLWVVGAEGTVLRRQGEEPLERVVVDTRATLFTVHGAGQTVYAAGGHAQGVIVELGDAPRVETLSTPFLQGVHVSADGEVVAVGGLGTIVRKSEEGQWVPVGDELDLVVESLHAVWTAPDGFRLAVGGSVVSPELDEGLMLIQGEGAAPEIDETLRPEPPPELCPDEVLTRGAEHSVARRWIEQNLAAIRLEVPMPPVHARNLYHLSLALFDAWSLFDAEQEAILVDASLGEGVRDTFSPEEWSDARHEAMSVAAYRLLAHRYDGGLGAAITRDCLDRTLVSLGYDPALMADERGPAGRLGEEVAQTIIDAFAQDGSLEASGYQSPDYESLAPPLVVDDAGTLASDPSLWQPLDLAQAVTQNGIAVDSGVQGYIGPHWAVVTPFAIERSAADRPYVTPGPRPEMGADMRDWVVDVIRRTSWLDANSEERMDASPGAYGNNTLGADDGEGHALNPSTGRAYDQQIVSRSDFGRVLAEYWADGPDSETPPGHWNTLAHKALDHPLFERRFYGDGEEVEALTFDVHLYLVLNGALHDAAIAAWELKRLYETSRPITLIRWMGARGQSSDPTMPSYDPQGLPLIEGLIEVVTEASAAPGMRHEHLQPYIGQVVLFTWPGAPGDHEHRYASCVWQRAVEWSPYQPRTFVSPAFPGYVSGHSAFSRSAAEVLAGLTGSEFFPGGRAEFVANAGEFLKFENGPSQEVRLQWATYFDAADQAGQSRIWGGIHILADDYDGRLAGAQVGERALEWAEENLVRLQR
ncbi:hypothetical protein DV096_01910 [Bradymonadaceae bacterium TMQ3]|nr:hypothetical protein DV096_01910 [Bradymonadaceae bacterium TMQ3]TXC77902.1 hypothetical protein FRC91_03995 [Bradymonadales bacterium TMQ1]